jgi:hypothetical protein
MVHTLKRRGADVHTLDQSFRVEAGTGDSVFDGVLTGASAGVRSSIRFGQGFFFRFCPSRLVPY